MTPLLLALLGPTLGFLTVPWAPVSDFFGATAGSLYRPIYAGAHPFGPCYTLPANASWTGKRGSFGYDHIFPRAKGSAQHCIQDGDARRCLAETSRKFLVEKTDTVVEPCTTSRCQYTTVPGRGSLVNLDDVATMSLAKLYDALRVTKECRGGTVDVASAHTLVQYNVLLQLQVKESLYTASGLVSEKDVTHKFPIVLGTGVCDSFVAPEKN